jgi:small subunit ribosomal protein S20
VAHHRSAKKRIRQTEKRTAVNRSRMSRIKTFVRKVEDALAKGDPSLAQAAFREAEPEIRRGISKGVLHINTASRKISRLSRRVKALVPVATSA